MRWLIRNEHFGRFICVFAKRLEEQLLQLGAQIAFENYRARLNRVQC
jgi:hypothetical protein